MTTTGPCLVRTVASGYVFTRALGGVNIDRIVNLASIDTGTIGENNFGGIAAVCPNGSSFSRVMPSGDILSGCSLGKEG